MISYDSVSFRKFCKGSYKLGDLRDTEILIADEDDNSFMVDSAGRFTRIPVRSSSTSGSVSGTSSNSAITSGPVSSRTSS